MNLAAILTLVITFLETLPRLVSAGIDVFERTKQLVAVLKNLRDENRDPTPEEWDALHATLKVDEEKFDSDTK